MCLPLKNECRACQNKYQQLPLDIRIACFESYRSPSLLRSTAPLPHFKLFPSTALSGSLVESSLSPSTLALSLVLRPPLTVTGWLVDWLFLGGGKEGREGDYHERPAARSWPRPPRARPPPADSHFPHSFASKARFLPQSLGEALPLRFASFLPVEEGGHGAALATKATAVERELEQTHSRAGRDTEVREGP